MNGDSRPGWGSPPGQPADGCRIEELLLCPLCSCFSGRLDTAAQTPPDIWTCHGSSWRCGLSLWSWLTLQTWNLNGNIFLWWAWWTISAILRLFKSTAHPPFVFGAAHHSFSILLIVTKQQRPVKEALLCETSTDGFDAMTNWRDAPTAWRSSRAL